MIENQLPRGIMKYKKCLPIYATHIITPFLYPSFLANHDKMEGLSANFKILIKGN